MGRFEKPVIILIILLSFAGNFVYGQNYRDQKKLIRLKPNNLLVFGEIKNSSGEIMSGATISLFDPSAAKILETIPIDDLGEYLFTLEMGRTFGFIVEKEGYFPYYTQFIVPSDVDEEWEFHINLPEAMINRYDLIYSGESATPSNQEVLDELINILSSFRNLSVWVPGEPDSLFLIRTANLRNNFLEAGIETYRLLSGNPPANPENFIRLHIINEPGSDGISNSENTDSDINNDSEQTDDKGKWTLQFIASKNELPVSDLNGIENFKLFRGKDGYFRYTYGIYDSKEEADSGKEYLRSKGFGQSFAKMIEDLQKL